MPRYLAKHPHTAACQAHPYGQAMSIALQDSMRRRWHISREEVKRQTNCEQQLTSSAAPAVGQGLMSLRAMSS